MRAGSFASESDFQRLLADFPALLAGDQVDSTTPRRWMLVKREKSIPSEEGGAGRWSVDHLFLDQDGIPTLVEVKRQSDTRIRREVLGQMLDYAANCIVYWPIKELRSEFEARCNEAGQDPLSMIADLIGPDRDIEAYWEQVKTNLEAGKIRMLFVADRIPAELKRIVEFLNDQMDPAEVLALELRQYEGEGLKTLVPMVFGKTQKAQQKRQAGTGAGRQWDETSLFEELERRNGSNIAATAQRITDWMKSNADRVWFGSGARSGSIGTAFLGPGGEFYPLVLWTYGKVEVAFQWIIKPPFNDEDKRRELMRRISEATGLELRDYHLDKRPAIELARLAEPERMSNFLNAMDWFVSEVRKPLTL